MTTATFAFLSGIVYLGLGLLGMLPSLVLQPPPDLAAHALYGELFGAFPVSTPLCVLHALLGLSGIVAWSAGRREAGYARALAAVSGILALMGMLPGLQTFFGLMPLQGTNIWLHGTTALAAAYFGFRQTTILGHAERRRLAADRRQAARPVVVERREGHYDRRHGGYGGTLAAG